MYLSFINVFCRLRMILYIIGKNPTVLIEKKPNKIQNLGLYSNIPLRDISNRESNL